VKLLITVEADILDPDAKQARHVIKSAINGDHEILLYVGSDYEFEISKVELVPDGYIYEPGVVESE
jgi:hypothetical protein